MLKTFKVGGIHPPENKLSAGAVVETLPLPEMVIIPVSQHIGAPAQIMVQKGDAVKVGTIIAKQTGFVSANIHSSVSGIVQKIEETFDTSGYRRKAIVINVDGDQWEDSIDQTTTLKTDIELSTSEIIQRISELGIVGLGGATFPTHVKLSIPSGKTAEILIINAVECEPYLTADHRLMLESPDEIMVGTTILMNALGVKKAVIGIEKNKPDAIAKLTETAKKYQGISVVPLKVKYPQGAEKQLIKAIFDREIPSGKLPIEVGAVVQNVGTAFAVYEAIQKNKPLIERIVTVTGKSVSKPSNFKVRIGTPVQKLIDHIGGLPKDTAKVVNGGPMMGKALRDLNVPVTKGTSGILILNKKLASRKEYVNCIRCGRCVTVCPMGLEPFLLMTHGELQMWGDAEKNHVMDCIECGSCSFTCPAHRPLLDYIRHGKSNVGKIMRNRK
ncbi:MAG: electron transport complex subunit RsxC [Salinivirgaceae bacterium]|nr:electron transport complex subunit RsxC [Salinivirgaceae bacterium]MDY0279303.1 electron transport complex subunit RsxC [Salinivirgaceae bacterium]